jgi:hypothetical protein
MTKAEPIRAWVVYRMTIHGRQDQVNAVCEQWEWEAMERERPGYHTLVRAAIPSEPEAEKLARGSAGDRGKSPPRRL